MLQGNILNTVMRIDCELKPARFSLATWTQAQARQSLFHSENGLGGGTSTSTRIKIFPFSFVAKSENEIPLRRNTSSRIFTTRGYVWPIKTLDPDSHAPKQFVLFGWFCLCFWMRRISFSLGSSLLLEFVLASLVITRLKWSGRLFDKIGNNKAVLGTLSHNSEYNNVMIWKARSLWAGLSFIFYIVKIVYFLYLIKLRDVKRYE